MVDWVCWTVSVVVVRVNQAKWQRSLLNLYWFYFHSFTIFFPPQTSLWEQFSVVCWSSCGWVVWTIKLCHPDPMSLSGLPITAPRFSVLYESQLLWTQTTVPLVLPELGMHSAILSCLSASTNWMPNLWTSLMCQPFPFFIFISLSLA